MHLLIVEARFYDELLDELTAGAAAALKEAGATFEVVSVDGALEVPGAIAIAEKTGRFDGYVALGVVIRGKTIHFEIVSEVSARGIMDLTVQHALCIGNGIQTVENADQAWQRCRVNELNKGGGAAKAALALIALKTELDRT